MTMTIVCDLCGSPDRVATVSIRIRPDISVQTDVCAACRNRATAVDVIEAGRPADSDRLFPAPRAVTYGP